MFDSSVLALGSRKIVHGDMDAFYVSVERATPRPCVDTPLFMAWKGKRSVVCAASYEACKFGIRSAMPAVSVERLGPDAIFVPLYFMRYKAASQAMREIFGDAPLVV